MTLPTVPQVLDQLAVGTCTRAQAVTWIDEHIAEAVRTSCDRDSAARSAMQTLMADPVFRQDVTNSGRNMVRAVARQAYAYADAMHNARGS